MYHQQINGKSIIHDNIKNVIYLGIDLTKYVKKPEVRKLQNFAERNLRSKKGMDMPCFLIKRLNLIEIISLQNSL